MPWKELSVLEQRKNFILELLKSNEPLKILCTKYGISEKTGHKWKKRFLENGYCGLSDQSKSPKHSPDQLSEDAVIRLIKIRTSHPTWGPKKIAVLYARAYPQDPCPSASSIYRVLGKAELIKKQKVRKVAPDNSLLRNRIEPLAPNDVWTVDFKGYWYSNNEQCLPLTVRDLHSKYILSVTLMKSASAEAVKEVFERLFKKYGLPKVIRSDNGSPFAARSNAHGLTTLSVWWVSLGILPDRILPGKPTQNGSHERMHADLSREIQGKIPGGAAANQKALDMWVQDYNDIRPHEALGMLTPSEVYSKSSLLYNGSPDRMEYPIGFSSRKVHYTGYIKVNGLKIQISSALKGIYVGLQPCSNSEYLLWLADLPLGKISTETACFSCSF